MAANLPQLSAIPMNLPQTFSREQLLACASGAMFGPQGARLPSDPMLMFDRITEIREDGGRHDQKKSEKYGPAHPKRHLLMVPGGGVAPQRFHSGLVPVHLPNSYWDAMTM